MMIREVKQMIYNRSDEKGNALPRSSRIFNMENVWYFSTCEGADIGPFNSRFEADVSLQDSLQFIQLANKETLREFLSTLNTQKGPHTFN